MVRNEEYWSLSRSEQSRFWQSIAKKINDIFRTQFTGDQVRIK